MFDIPCVIFAGGKSSRMGEDKALLPFFSFKTLTEFQYSRLSKIFKTVYISCKNKNKFDFEASFIEDIQTNDIHAPSVVFVSIFQTIQENSFFAISVDTPFIGQEQIELLIKKHTRKNDATIASLNSKMQPLCGVYSRSLEKEFQKMVQTDNHKLGSLLKKSNTEFIEFNDEKAFLNCNTPQEYQEALTLISL